MRQEVNVTENKGMDLNSPPSFSLDEELSPLSHSQSESVWTMQTNETVRPLPASFDDRSFNKPARHDLDWSWDSNLSFPVGEGFSDQHSSVSVRSRGSSRVSVSKTKLDQRRSRSLPPASSQVSKQKAIRVELRSLTEMPPPPPSLSLQLASAPYYQNELPATIPASYPPPPPQYSSPKARSALGQQDFTYSTSNQQSSLLSPAQLAEMFSVPKNLDTTAEVAAKQFSHRSALGSRFAAALSPTVAFLSEKKSSLSFSQSDGTSLTEPMSPASYSSDTQEWTLQPSETSSTLELPAEKMKTSFQLSPAPTKGSDTPVSFSELAESTMLWTNSLDGTREPLPIDGQGNQQASNRPRALFKQMPVARLPNPALSEHAVLYQAKAEPELEATLCFPRPDRLNEQKCAFYQLNVVLDSSIPVPFVVSNAEHMKEASRPGLQDSRCQERCSLPSPFLRGSLVWHFVKKSNNCGSRSPQVQNTPQEAWQVSDQPILPACSWKEGLTVSDLCEAEDDTHQISQDLISQEAQEGAKLNLERLILVPNANTQELDRNEPSQEHPYFFRPAFTPTKNLQTFYETTNNKSSATTSPENQLLLNLCDADISDVQQQNTPSYGGLDSQAPSVEETAVPSISSDQKEDDFLSPQSTLPTNQRHTDRQIQYLEQRVTELELELENEKSSSVSLRETLLDAYGGSMNEALNQQFIKIEDECQNQKYVNETLRLQLNDVNETLKELQEKNSALEAELFNEKNRCSALHQNLEDQDEIMDIAYKEQFSLLQAELFNEKNKMMLLSQALEDEYEHSRMWEEKCSILQEELVNEKDITMALTRALREGDERMQGALSGQFAELDMALRDAEAENEALKEHTARLEHALKSADMMHEALNQRNMHLEQELQARKAIPRSLETSSETNSSATIREVLEEITKMSAGFERERLSWEAEKESLQHQILAEQHHFERERQEASHEIQFLKQKVTALSNLILEMKQRQQETRSDCCTYTNQDDAMTLGPR